MAGATASDMRLVIAGVLLAHGLAHVVGFVGAWGPTRTTILNGRIDLGRRMRLVGLLWMLFAIGFVVAAAAAFANTGWWTSLALGFAGASLALCLVLEPETRFGIVLNAALIAVIAWGRHAGWY